jgi:hypothetical protein
MPARTVLLALLALAIAPSGAAASLLRGHPPAAGAGAVAWVNGGGTLLLSRYR